MLMQVKRIERHEFMDLIRRGGIKAKVPLGIYGITSDAYGGMDHVSSAKALLEGGIKILQYRNKGTDFETMVNEATEIKALCNQDGAAFIVNDHLDLAMKVDADGVHLGQRDMKFKEAKRAAGRWLDGKIVGISVSHSKQAREAEAEGADYLGASTIFQNNTKSDGEVIGVDGLREIRGASRLPIFAVGGMKLDHISLMKEYGIEGMAVISGILAEKDPVSAAREYVGKWNGSHL